jgi:hypothetical protein
MKLAILYAGLLVGAAGVVVLLGDGPAVARWGEAGRASLRAAAVIGAVAAVIAALPAAVLAARRSGHVAQACVAGTAIRLVVTFGLAFGYQALCTVHLRSFLAGLTAVYLLLLVVETAVNVALVRRVYSPRPGGG